MIPNPQHKLLTLFAPWLAAFIVLALYYTCIQFPMEKSFIKGLNDMQAHKNVQAQEEFHKVLNIYPNYEPVYYNLARIYRYKGLWLEARDSLRKAYAISLMNAGEFSERGSVYYANYGYARDSFFNKHVINGYLWVMLNGHGQN